MITGVWLSPDGEKLAVQLDCDEIYLTDWERTVTPESISGAEVTSAWSTLYERD